MSSETGFKNQYNIGKIYLQAQKYKLNWEDCCISGKEYFLHETLDMPLSIRKIIIKLIFFIIEDTAAECTKRHFELYTVHEVIRQVTGNV